MVPISKSIWQDTPAEYRKRVFIEFTANFLNSPVNFIYVTKDENIAILDEKIADYTKRITKIIS